MDALQNADFEGQQSLPTAASVRSTASKSIGLNFSVPVNNVVLYSSTGGQITANGSIAFNSNLDLKLKIQNHQVEQFAIENINSDTVNLTAASTGNLDVSTGDVPIGPPLFEGDITFWLPTTPPFPVVVSTSLQLVGGIQGTVSSNASATINQNATSTLGLSYDSGQWTPIDTCTNTFSYSLPSSTFTVNSAKAYLGLTLNFLLYDLAGPDLKFDAYLRSNASSTDEALYGGIEAFCGADVPLLGLNYSAQVLSYEKLLTSTGTTANFWTESFEKYAIGTWPSTWTPDGNAMDQTTNYVDGSTSSNPSGTRSLKMFGQDSSGASWGALAYHPLNVTPPFEIMIDMRSGAEKMLGVQPWRAGLMLRQGTYWTNPARQLIQFTQAGNITDILGNTLTTYSSGVWYSFDILYERPTSSTVRVTYKINGVSYGSETTSATSSESTLTNLNLGVGQGSAWFDNIYVYQR